MKREPGIIERTVQISSDGAELAGALVLPPDARAVVAFAHGSGSGRFSPRNQYVAGVLQDRGMGTLLIDLLTEEEEAADRSTGHIRFDIPLLAGRVVSAVDWLERAEQTSEMPVGLFGASTGAAAALIAAAQAPRTVGAVVSRGGRPDLAMEQLPDVGAPTLLIVGGADVEVIEMNRRALHQLRAEARLEIVPGASHLFEEPGALEQVASLARDWFLRSLLRRERL